MNSILKITSKTFLICLMAMMSLFYPIADFAATTPQMADFRANKPPIAVKDAPKTLMILTLHHFTTDPSQVTSITIEMNRLENQILAYQKAGYQFVRLGEVDTVEKPIILTIDDGYESVYTLFYPMAKRLNIPFNFNVIMGRIESMQNTEIPKCQPSQLMEMKNSGLCQLGVHSFNAHGFGHREGLVKLNEETWEDYQDGLYKDTLSAINTYKRLFNEIPTIYAYPYGNFSDQTERLLKEMGFVYTLTSMRGINSSNEHYALKRINLN